MDVISCFDDKGPAWYWNRFTSASTPARTSTRRCTGSRARICRTTACDTIPVRRFVGPACVIDVSREVAANEDFLLMPEHVDAWEKTHGRIPKDSWVSAAHRLEQARRRDVVSQRSRRRAAQPGLSQDDVGAPGARPRRARRRRRDGRHRCGAGGSVRSAISESHDDARRGQVRVGEPLTNLDQLPATGAIVIAAPLKIVNGSGSPLRVLAIAPKASRGD